MSHAAENPRPPRRTRRRGWATLLVGAAVVGGAGYWGYTQVYDSVVPARCTITAGGMTETFSPEQTGNSALIAGLSIKRDLPPRAATIALTTAYQESKIRNIQYGDRDSLGLFQQRPSQGWGTDAQVLDPIHSTNAFYDALVKFTGYETADITVIAQKVQRSAYPDAYRDHEGQGRVLASTLTGHSPAGLTCRLKEATGSADPKGVAKDLADQLGITTSTPGPGVLTVTAPDQRIAWAVGQWAVARAEQYGATKVSVGDRTWDRSKRSGGWSDGAASTTVTISLPG